jgi:membrane protein implicated in regulation of membrane protease activity
MWSQAAVLAQTLWQWLPELTIALRFLTSLIGFVVATLVLARRIRRWHRRRRSRR